MWLVWDARTLHQGRDHVSVARLLHSLGQTLFAQGAPHYAEAKKHIDEAMRIFRALGLDDGSEEL